VKILLQHNISPEDKHFIFYLNEDKYFIFRIGVPFKKVKHILFTEGFFHKNKKETMIYYNNYLSDPMMMLHRHLKWCFRDMSANIRPELFNCGVGHYMNMRSAYEYKNEDDETPLDLDKRFPVPSLTGQPIQLWSTPRSYNAYQTWIYNHNQHVYIELGELYDWGDYEHEEDHQRFQHFIKNYQFERFEISYKLAQTWVEQIWEVAKYSPQLQYDLDTYIKNSYSGDKNI
jgi:hypothetical protein